MKRPTAFLELESFAFNNNAEGDFNTANGAFALVANTTGERNTATGDSALFSNNTGNRNTAIGNAALGLNTTGTDNTAISSSVCPREPIYFRDRFEVFYDWDWGFKSLSSQACRKLDSCKASAIPAATDANFLTAASVSCGACAACGVCGFPRSGPTTFHIFYWLQVTNFSFLKSAPNGVN